MYEFCIEIKQVTCPASAYQMFSHFVNAWSTG